MFTNSKPILHQTTNSPRASTSKPVTSNSPVRKSTQAQTTSSSVSTQETLQIPRDRSPIP
jgi:hypothetical protein